MNFSLTVVTVFLTSFVLGGCSESDNGTDTLNPEAGVNQPQTPADSNGTGEPVDDPPVQQPTPSPAVQPAIGSIENLFGRVEFDYGFTGGSNRFTETVVFSAASEIESNGLGRTVQTQSASGSVLNCSEFNIADWNFLCISIQDQGPQSQLLLDIFLFKMDSQLTGLGNYEFCDYDPRECGENVVLSPDGPVQVAITRTKITDDANIELNNMPITGAEALDYKFSDKLEFGMAPEQVDNTHLTKELVDLVSQALLETKGQ